MLSLPSFVNLEDRHHHINKAAREDTGSFSNDTELLYATALPAALRPALLTENIFTFDDAN